MKNWTAFFGCLLISFGFWLVMMLSRTNSDIKTIPVIAVSNLEGYSQKSVDIVDVAARCKASGFKLLRMSGFSRAVEVRFAPEDMMNCGDGIFEINPSSLYRYVSEIFGAGVTVESFVVPEIKFTFSEEIFRKIPVIPSTSISCAPQYMLHGEVLTVPDSVLVYGDPKLIETVSSVKTRLIDSDAVKNDLHGVVKLEVPAGVRLSAEEVSYSVTVRRFVEFSRIVPVVAHNVPDGVEFSFFPNNVEVIVRASFPMKQNPFDVLEFFIDYQDFEKSITGQCVIRAQNAPKNLISWTSTPEICNCVVRQ